MGDRIYNCIAPALSHCHDFLGRVLPQEHVMLCSNSDHVSHLFCLVCNYLLCPTGWRGEWPLEGWGVSRWRGWSYPDPFCCTTFNNLLMHKMNGLMREYETVNKCVQDVRFALRHCVWCFVSQKIVLHKNGYRYLTVTRILSWSGLVFLRGQSKIVNCAYEFGLIDLESVTLTCKDDSLLLLGL